MIELTEQQQNISFAEGFLETWTDTQPQQVKDNLKLLIEGIAWYRKKYIDLQEDFSRQQQHYNNLTALSANYIAQIAQQREQIDQILTEDQREYHKTE